MSEAVSRDAAGAARGPSAAESVLASPALHQRAAELIAEAGLEARRLELSAGQSIYEPQTDADSVYLLHQGQVRILLQTPDAGERAVRLLEILGPGDWFGTPAFVGDKAYATRALAVTEAVVSAVPADRLLAALPSHPAIATALIRSLSAKLQASYAEAANLVFSDTNRRLINALLQFSRTAAATPQQGPEGRGVELRITHQQLAQAIGAARETVSLALTQLRQKNLLRTGRNRLSFSPDALATFAKTQGGKAAGDATPAGSTPQPGNPG